MVLIVAIIGMIIIMVRERNRVLVIETEAQTIHRVQHNGNIVQHHITILSTYGETALSWEEEDFANYHSLRLHIDSMLQAMHKGYEEFVSQSQIDSLYNPQNQKSRFQKRKIKKNGKRFVDSLYSLIDLKTI